MFTELSKETQNLEQAVGCRSNEPNNRNIKVICNSRFCFHEGVHLHQECRVFLTQHPENRRRKFNSKITFEIMKTERR
jgi:hypothetical protein